MQAKRAAEKEQERQRDLEEAEKLKQQPPPVDAQESGDDEQSDPEIAAAIKREAEDQLK